MKRRSFLTGSITVPVLGAAIATAAVARDPHPDLLRRWRDVEKRLSGAPDDQRIIDEQTEIERQLMATCAKTPVGMAAQIQFAIEYRLVGDCFVGAEMEGLDSEMFGNIVTALQAA
ncbi:hypothetical protein PhaeoP72_01214 [Phaeobacter inhibens]|uniref:hypothetical protein n=1 Tax=Phaeobacter inhibens TaxID=221822 RepID=UPI000C9D2605|nr:hypothetical protein [Phaeobacter inhibens]AUR03199.1 hypothetical protein PhaeoP72_01214 [Phaeobacter inhibens]